MNAEESTSAGILVQTHRQTQTLHVLVVCHETENHSTVQDDNDDVETMTRTRHDNDDDVTMRRQEHDNDDNSKMIT
jgi:hypothetical protein